MNEMQKSEETVRVSSSIWRKRDFRSMILTGKNTNSQCKYIYINKIALEIFEQILMWVSSKNLRENIEYLSQFGENMVLDVQFLQEWAFTVSANNSEQNDWARNPREFFIDFNTN